MNASSRHVQNVYLLLLLLHTLAASFIWGINTLFLLDAKFLIRPVVTGADAATIVHEHGVQAIGHAFHVAE